MPKVALGVEYDGTELHGWQSQRGRCSVQQALTEALSRVADERIVVHGAGRTDAGVHALQQVAHFESRARRAPRQWVLGANSLLPDDVRVQWACNGPDDCDARRSALSRRYRYLVLEAGVDAPLLRHRVWRRRERLDVAAMSAAAVAWLGENDFSSFRAAGCQSRTPMRRLIRVGVTRAGRIVVFEFVANAFLHHMVRNLVGTLVEIGAGRRPPEWGAQLLAARDRRLAAPTAPAQGLTLVDVAYPEHYGIPRAVERDAWLAMARR
jgi:tRNA pseudouridine38-40 synthase